MFAPAFRQLGGLNELDHVHTRKHWGITIRVGKGLLLPPRARQRDRCDLRAVPPIEDFLRPSVACRSNSPGNIPRAPGVDLPGGISTLGFW